MKKSILVLMPVLWIMLGIVAVPCGADDSATIATATYASADGRRLTARYNNAAATVSLRLPDGKAVTLPAAMSASGARYSNGTLTFWEHQGSATFFRGDSVLFEGKEVETGKVLDAVVEKSKGTANSGGAERPSAKAIAGYAGYLKKTDKHFGNPAPTDSFACMLDSGRGGQPLSAFCTNKVDRVSVSGEWASVEFVVTPVEDRNKRFPVMADGALFFLMKKERGAWRGVTWFLGSDGPSISRRVAKAAGISGNSLSAMGWRIAEE